MTKDQVEKLLEAANKALQSDVATQLQNTMDLLNTKMARILSGVGSEILKAGEETSVLEEVKSGTI